MSWVLVEHNLSSSSLNDGDGCVRLRLLSLSTTSQFVLCSCLICLLQGFNWLNILTDAFFPWGYAENKERHLLRSLHTPLASSTFIHLISCVYLVSLWTKFISYDFISLYWKSLKLHTVLKSLAKFVHDVCVFKTLLNYFFVFSWTRTKYGVSDWYKFPSGRIFLQIRYYFPRIPAENT